MKKRCGRAVFAALAAVFAGAGINCANAQETFPSIGQPLPHLAADEMSAADRALVDAHLSEIAATARIYGYSFEAENWSYEQTLCPPLTDTMLLHYRRLFVDGTVSLFTALIPRTSGRVRVVPVLYHNTTPYLPAPKNPRNYAVFNELVPEETARRDATPNGNWLELSACYAEMTGGDINILPDRTIAVGVAASPSATNHIDVQNRTIRVTLADRESQSDYRVWSISFNRVGRVKAATTDRRPVYAAKNVSQPQPAAAPATTNQPEQPTEAAAQPATTQSPEVTTNQPAKEKAESRASSSASASAPSSALGSTASSSSSTATRSLSATASATVTAGPNASATLAGVSAKASEPASEPGWKFVMHPKEPPSKIVPPGPPPREKIKPEPPDPTATPQPQ